MESIEQDFLTYLASTNESEYQKLFTFAVDSLTFANKVHIYHWSCDSGFHHTHFQEIYETIRNFADSLVEIVLAEGKDFAINSKNYLISDEVYNLDEALNKIRFYIQELEKYSNAYSSKPAIVNLIDDTIQKLENEFGLIKKFK